MNQKQYLNTEEVCEALQVSRGKLFELVKDGLPHLRLGQRTYRFVLKDVENWLKENTKELSTND